MILPKPVRTRLAEEFRFAADGMAKTGDFQRKLYFYSAFYGEVQRAMNVAWDSELALLYYVGQLSHQSLVTAVTSIQLGAERVLGLPPSLAAELTKVGERLAVLFEGTKPIDSAELMAILSRVAELTYVTSGNGQWLLMREKIKV